MRVIDNEREREREREERDRVRRKERKIDRGFFPLWSGF